MQYYRNNKTLSSPPHLAMFRKLDGAWGTECLNIKFSRLSVIKLGAERSKYL